ncbi:MAG: metal ABC transporter permease [Patescibacteria group bacterium]|nr:metal ABC transporter permease [Patescibacteria group bacterium]
MRPIIAITTTAVNTNIMTSANFNWNIISDLQMMLQYPFMQHAFEAGTIVAVVAGIVGYFVILRRSSFAAHALSHIGFAGAAGAVLMSLNPIVGLLVFTVGGGVAMATFGRKAMSRDVQIGIVLAFMLGIGVLFISLYTGYATEAYSILFGQILGISASDVLVTLIAALVILFSVAVIYRPLLFSSLSEDIAEAKGISIFWFGVFFMILLAVATSISVQVVGVLLIFALMVTPAAIAQRMTRHPAQGILLAVIIALLATWFGLFVSFYLPYPVSFFITTITFLGYSAVRFFEAVKPKLVSA